MNILKDSEIFSAENVAKIEEMKHAKYICETCLIGTNGGWVNSPVAVFWIKDPANIPAGGSPWFGLFYRFDPFDPEKGTSTLMITNAISAVQHPIQGLMADNGDIIYSRYRHDFRRHPEYEHIWIDGGRDYMRWGGSGKPVMLQIVDGDLTISGIGVYKDD